MKRFLLALALISCTQKEVSVQAKHIYTTDSLINSNPITEISKQDEKLKDTTIVWETFELFSESPSNNDTNFRVLQTIIHDSIIHTDIYYSYQGSLIKAVSRELVLSKRIDTLGVIYFKGDSAISVFKRSPKLLTPDHYLKVFKWNTENIHPIYKQMDQ